MDAKIVELLTDQCLTEILGNSTIAIDLIAKYSEVQGHMLPPELQEREEVT